MSTTTKGIKIDKWNICSNRYSHINIEKYILKMLWPWPLWLNWLGIALDVQEIAYWCFILQTLKLLDFLHCRQINEALWKKEKKSSGTCEPVTYREEKIEFILLE